jgi:hypothetical protein
MFGDRVRNLSKRILLRRGFHLGRTVLLFCLKLVFFFAELALAL